MVGFLGGGVLAGVDMGSAGIKVVTAAPGAAPAVLDAVWRPTPDGAVVNGAVADPAPLARAVAEALHGQRAVAAVGPQQAVARVLRFPRMSERELDGALRWEMDKFIPWTGESCVDRVVLPGGREEMEVLLVAAQRRAVEGLVAVFQAARSPLRAVDLEALAAQRALQVLGLVPADPRGVHAVVDLGEAATRVIIFSQGVPVVSRSIAPGGREFAAAIAAGLGVEAAEAEAAKRRWGVAADTPVSAYVRPLAEKLCGEIWRSLEFFLLLNQEAVLGRVFLIGGNAMQPGMAELVRERLAERLAGRGGQDSGGEMVSVVDPAPLFGEPPPAPLDQVDARFVISLGLAFWKGQ